MRTDGERGRGRGGGRFVSRASGNAVLTRSVGQTFWLFQTYLHDLAANPQADAFRTCRRVYNKVQHIVFGLPDAARHEKITENVLPVTVLASFVLAGVGLPMFPQWAGPLAVAQARKPSPSGDAVPEAAQNAKPSRAHTVNSATTTRSKRPKDGNRVASAPAAKSPVETTHLKAPRQPSSAARPSSSGSSPRTPSDPDGRPRAQVELLEARLSSSSLPAARREAAEDGRPANHARLCRPAPGRHALAPALAPRQDPPEPGRHDRRPEGPASEAELFQVPDPVPHSARGHLQPAGQRSQASPPERAPGRAGPNCPGPAGRGGRACDLPPDPGGRLAWKEPAPSYCPPNPAEATVLNSAEKVPYLLMVEILHDDFNFDPESQDNQRLLANLLAEQGVRKRIFDLSDAPRIPTAATRAAEPVIDSVFEPTSGDLGSSPMLKPYDDDAATATSRTQAKIALPNHAQRLSSGATTATTAISDTTPRSSATSTSRSSSPGPLLRKMTFANPRNSSVDQPDFSALATHMRTASQMLAQLEATSGKRPRHEVAAIRAKIIASMQSLEEQSFDLDDGQGPTFDLIMAKANVVNVAANGADLEEDSTLEPGINPNAGVARMENDFKTGGLQRKGDRDDPSAAVFGEAWEVKKERIRRSSPYGWMKNWDLVSVIVKTGADLRQEAFACQLINVCHKIWVDAGVSVWVKMMRILVTGESSGLIETITNGVSLHSIKRSLTLSSIESGQNPRRRIASLKDHFVKAFGSADSEPYKAGVDAFKRSLAAYSIISYILQLKDRHNGNILIDNEGPHHPHRLRLHAVQLARVGRLRGGPLQVDARIRGSPGRARLARVRGLQEALQTGLPRYGVSVVGTENHGVQTY